MKDLRIAIIGGMDDPLVLVEQKNQFASILSEAGACVELLMEENDYSICNVEVEHVRQWLKTQL